MKQFLFVVLFFNVILSFGQNCDCPKEFDFLVNKIEKDYAGFKDKVNGSNIEEYNKFTELIRTKTKNTQTFRRCTTVLDEWLKFFNDKHLSLSSEFNIYFTYKRIDDNAILLRIPNFAWESKAMIDSLILKNKKEITSTPILIIDLRGNGGGTDYSYLELLPLLYTNPYKTKGVEWWASQGNIDFFEKSFKEGNIKKGKENEMKLLIETLKKHPNTFVSSGG